MAFELYSVPKYLEVEDMQSHANSVVCNQELSPLRQQRAGSAQEWRERVASECHRHSFNTVFWIKELP